MSWHRFEALVFVFACSAMVACGGNGDLDASVLDGSVSDGGVLDADVVTNGASACALDCDGQLRRWGSIDDRLEDYLRAARGPG